MKGKNSVKRFVIIHATAGIGHTKAALAIKKTFDKMLADRALGQQPEEAFDIRIIDSLDYMTDFFRSSYQGSYLLMVKKLLPVWGALYSITNHPFVNVFVKIARRMTNAMHSRRLIDYLLEYQPDVVISTHFLATEVVSHLKEKKILTTRLITVVTDYRLHAFWIAKNVDAYIVAGEQAKQELIAWKVEPSRIKTFGIPIGPEFMEPGMDKVVLRRRLGLAEDLFTILVVGGGFGIGPIEDIIKTIERWDKAAQIAVICGYNPQLLERVKALQDALRHPIKAFGFVENMFEFMGASEVLISKSGGITITEALAKELPMIIVSPIPGQESRNCEFLVEHKAAVKAKDVAHLAEILEGFLKDPRKLSDMKSAIKDLKHPMASADIVKFASEI